MNQSSVVLCVPLKTSGLLCTFPLPHQTHLQVAIPTTTPALVKATPLCVIQHFHASCHTTTHSTSIKDAPYYREKHRSMMSQSPRSVSHGKETRRQNHWRGSEEEFCCLPLMMWMPARPLRAYTNLSVSLFTFHSTFFLQGLEQLLHHHGAV